MVYWQVQDAKQRFSELLRVAHLEGPQVVTRHGREIAVVIDIAEYRHLKGESVSFKEYLERGPGFDDLDLARSEEGPRPIDWGDE
jgi:prevent-host-death family protein